MHIRIASATALVAVLAASQSWANPPVQHAPAPDRGAAGSGSMGIGEGIHHGNQPTAGETGETRDVELPPRHPNLRDDNGGDGHGDHDTDMEHRRRN
ncbi:hypothetical protein [Stutzerimonas tarimensis]|uniref:Secreted protein n=1 Tax=Stutzerimonas tarimensis TaxID=1507735 RepID=A0ABV7T4I1_9GAMM